MTAAVVIAALTGIAVCAVAATATAAALRVSPSHRGSAARSSRPSASPRHADRGGVRFRTVDYPGAPATAINGVNDHGVLIGTYFSKPSGAGAAAGFVKSGRLLIPFNYPGTWGVTFPSAINDADVSVGVYKDKKGVLHGWIRSAAGNFVQIDDPLAGTKKGQGTQAENINRAGVIVGAYYDSKGVEHGLVYRNGRFRTVNAPGAGTASGQGTSVRGINDKGVLTGEYIDARGLLHAFVDSSRTFFEFKAPGALGPAREAMRSASATRAESPAP